MHAVQLDATGREFTGQAIELGNDTVADRALRRHKHERQGPVSRHAGKMDHAIDVDQRRVPRHRTGIGGGRTKGVRQKRSGPGCDQAYRERGNDFQTPSAFSRESPGAIQVGDPLQSETECPGHCVRGRMFIMQARQFTRPGSWALRASAHSMVRNDPCHVVGEDDRELVGNVALRGFGLPIRVPIPVLSHDRLVYSPLLRGRGGL